MYNVPTDRLNTTILFRRIEYSIIITRRTLFGYRHFVSVLLTVLRKSFLKTKKL